MPQFMIAWIKRMNPNIDRATVASFGDEWSRFDQSAMADAEARAIFDEYFSIFPWNSLPQDAIGFDMGCGSGRWARLVAPRVGHLNCIDPSNAIELAKLALSDQCNVSFHKASVDDGALPLGSQDFGYSLGVLHHVPDTAAALHSCVVLLKPGAPFLLYLYYAVDGRPPLFKVIWRASDLLRRGVVCLPAWAKHLSTEILAAVVYWPLARIARWMDWFGLDVANVPLSYYRKRSYFTMRTDARDRFGTPLERRFSKDEISAMMTAAGLRGITFSERAPFWCAIGIKE